jgi:Agenet domain
MVGLVEWKDKEEFESFPQEGRKDVVLRDLLKDRGVPASQMVYLPDEQATTARINDEFSKTLAKTRPGDWLIVYFEGHGYKDDEGEHTFLAGYDASDDVEGWPITSIPDAIDKNFRGSNAMIALDNCYSGAMAEAVRSKKRKINYAVMASSLASQTSTGNWTFTEALISAFRGASYIDRNLDGKLTFFEMGENASLDMLFGEEQLATVTYTGSFDPQTVIGDSLGIAQARVGQRIEAYSVDGWYKGFIIDSKNGKFKIHYYGYEDTDDEWVAPKLIRDFKPKQYPVGSRVSVEWEKKWYPAKVIEVKSGVHYISYDNYGPEWNEWVGSERIRKTK